MDIAAVRTSLAGQGLLTGTVTVAASAAVATVDVGGTQITVQVARDLTLAVGDIALIARQNSAWWAIVRVFEAAPPEGTDDSDASPPVGATSGVTVITPVQTRSYRSSGWRSDTDAVYQGDYGGWGNHTGCAFYGGKPSSLSGATVTSATLALRRLRGGSYSSITGTLVEITQPTKPAGAPTVSGGSSITLPRVGATSSVVVPTAYAQALVDGTYGGLGLYVAGGSPYGITAGLSDYGAAWALTIRWTRS